MSSQPIPRRRRPTKWLLAGVALLIAVLLWWTLFRTVDVVETVKVSIGDVESSVTASGTLRPLSYVDIGAQASGAIRRIAVQPGSVVKKGDLLVEIDPSVQRARVDTDRAALDSLRAQLAGARAQREQAMQEAQRQRQMNADGATRMQDLQNADAALRTANARLADLQAQITGALSTLKGDEAQLGYTRIYAPMAGKVVTLDAREGQTLNATYQTPVIMRIADLSTMTVWTEVSEADVRRVRAGMRVWFTTLGEPRRWTGSVRQILPAPPNRSAGASAEAGAPSNASSDAGKVVLYTALFDVANPDGALMPQMTAQVFFVEASARQAVVAPLTALTATPGQPGWYTARVESGDGRITQRRVRGGVHDRVTTQVLDGLKAGERLVTAVRHERAAQGRFRW
jgi:membrane fusion protein, macrolide-specific efflux system